MWRRSQGQQASKDPSLRWGDGLLLGLLLAAGAAPAAPVISPGPDAVAVTVYRDPNRASGGTLDLDWLGGFALVSETRTVSLPAGTSELRFEGVAGGIIAVSAIVTGLPGGVIEKNRDARLLSPGALIDGSLGKRVTIRRTARATGKVSEEDAIVRAGNAGGIVLQTRGGIEAYGCAGLAETPLFDGVPQGLSARPTLAVTTTAEAPATATVTLSYLATGFDWSASYVATVAPDGRTLDLAAWLTLANGNGESFAQARTQAVAGTLNREARADVADDPGAADFAVECWPLGTTSQIPVSDLPMPPPPPPMMMSPMAAMASEDISSIVVTAQRRMEAVREELGDLKLYRIPEPVTVAANSQKQVALLEKTGVPFERLYRATVNPADAADGIEARMLLRARNSEARGLGLPLPSGTVAVFEGVGGRSMLAGEGMLRDSAVGEEVEVEIGSSAQVRLAVEGRGPAGRYRLTATNANRWPVTIEVTLAIDPASHALRDTSRSLGRKNGRPLWLARVPANASATLDYALKDVD